jgi:hypothetical protein
MNKRLIIWGVGTLLGLTCMLRIQTGPKQFLEMEYTVEI